LHQKRRQKESETQGILGSNIVSRQQLMHYTAAAWLCWPLATHRCLTVRAT